MNEWVADWIPHNIIIQHFTMSTMLMIIWNINYDANLLTMIHRQVSQSHPRNVGSCRCDAIASFEYLKWHTQQLTSAMYHIHNISCLRRCSPWFPRNPNRGGHNYYYYRPTKESTSYNNMYETPYVALTGVQGRIIAWMSVLLPPFQFLSNGGKT